jgi:hypothetical protein
VLKLKINFIPQFFIMEKGLNSVLLYLRNVKGMTSPKDIIISLVTALAVLAVAFVFIVVPNVNIASANSTNNIVAANVQVNAYCQLTISNTAVTFGSVIPGGSDATTNLILASSVGNANGNIIVAGTTWQGPGTNTMPVGNTLWNPTSAGVGVGTALSLYPTNTQTNIALPITAGSTAANNIFFGFSVAPGTAAPGIYTQTVVFRNQCTGAANSLTTNSVFTINVLSDCFISLSNSLISFGSLNPGSNTPYVSNEVSDTDVNGNTNANIIVEGGNWIGTTQFTVTNTTWAASNVVFTSGTQLTNTFVDTHIIMPYPPTSSTANIFFGVAVPPGEPSGTFTQNIIIENLC